MIRAETSEDQPPPPPDEPPLALATLTRRRRPSHSCSFIELIAFWASLSLLKVTKPNPRDLTQDPVRNVKDSVWERLYLPVSRSFMTMCCKASTISVANTYYERRIRTSVICPNWLKA
jgi:hypothetical protein